MRRQPAHTNSRFGLFTEGISLTGSPVPVAGRVIHTRPGGFLFSACFQRIAGAKTVFPRTPLLRWVARGQSFVRSHRIGILTRPDEVDCGLQSRMFRAPSDLKESGDNPASTCWR